MNQCHLDLCYLKILQYVKMKTCKLNNFNSFQFKDDQLEFTSVTQNK